jgi:predicted Rdx family selenoprotein
MIQKTAKIINDFMIRKLNWLNRSNDINSGSIFSEFQEELEEICKENNIGEGFKSSLNDMYFDYLDSVRNNFYQYEPKVGDKVKLIDPEVEIDRSSFCPIPIDTRSNFTIQSINSWDIVLFVDNVNNTLQSLNIRLFKKYFEVIE